VQSLLGKNEEAIQTLALAIADYPEYRETARDDPDLISLHAAATFRALIGLPPEPEPN